MPSCHDLVGDEQARLVRLFSLYQEPPEPFAKQMRHFRRVLRVTELMFLAGNKPKLKV